jgi:hypothetical protein
MATALRMARGIGSSSSSGGGGGGGLLRLLSARAATSGGSPTLLQHATPRRAWYSAGSGASGSAPATSESMRQRQQQQPELIEVVAELLAAQPSISLRDATKALKQSHPERWQQQGGAAAAGGGGGSSSSSWGSKDVRLAIKQLRDGGGGSGGSSAAAAAAAAAAAPAGGAGDGGGGGSVAWSAEPWGDAEQQRRDAAAGFVVSKDFQPFSQKNDIFCRSFWDSSVQSRRTQNFWQGFAPFSHGGDK